MCVEKGLRLRAVLRERHEVAEKTESECADAAPIQTLAPLPPHRAQVFFA